MRSYSLLLMTLFVLATSLVADIRIMDPADNLIGDKGRGYMDITEILVRQEIASVNVQICVNAPFPEPSTLLGTGMQFVFTFRGPDEETPAILECRLELNDQGWTIERIGNYSEVLPVDFRINPTDVSISLPYPIIGDAVSLEIDANTANRPKWKPLTANPAITVNLPPPPQRPETASH